MRNKSRIREHTCDPTSLHIWWSVTRTEPAWREKYPAVDFDLKPITAPTGYDEIGKQTQFSQFCVFSTPKSMWLGKYPLIRVSFTAKPHTSMRTHHVKISADNFKIWETVNESQFWISSMCQISPSIAALDWMQAQNCRMAEAGRDLQRLSCSTPPAQAGPPTAGCPGPCPDSFWISWRTETPPRLRPTCSSDQITRSYIHTWLSGRKTWDRGTKSPGPPPPLPWVCGLCPVTPYPEVAAC